MGFSSALLKMKFLIVCLFAAAYAAPALTYAGYPYAAAYHPYAYGAVAGYPYAHAAYSHVPTVAATHVLAKRSADADADADADAYYGHYGYAAHPYSYGYAAYRPYGYSFWG